MSVTSIPIERVEPPRTRVYRRGVLESEGFPMADVSDHLARPDTIVWVDLCAPSPADLLELAEELSLHELAVEDALGPHQRPKLDLYDTHLFLACHAVTLDIDQAELRTTEVDAFAGSRWLVTVRKDEGFDLTPVLRRWDRSPARTVQGVSFLLYALLDVIVDDYLEVIRQFDEYYDAIGDALFAETPMEQAQQRQWFEMRRALVRFHRLAVPVREVVSGLMRREHGVVADELLPYYQDVYDHVLRVSEASDALRDLVATLVETNLALRDYRQNQVMKKVTSWAAIIAVPTLITGFYGMNVPYPGAGQTWGAVASFVLTVTLAALLFVVFRRKEWL